MLSVATYNLDGLDERHLDLRAEAACFTLLLRPRPFDVLMLQEVVWRSWVAHLRHHLEAAGYDVFPPSYDRDREYACVIAVRRGVLADPRGAVVPFAGSGMHRERVEVRGTVGDREVLLSTAHLESLASGATQRMVQLADSLRMIVDHDGPAVFAGDLNLRDREAAAVPEVALVRDAWEATGADPLTRYTWDTRRNPNRASRWPGGAARMRFDRVFTHQCRATDLELIGHGPVPGAGGLFVSDHFGVAVDLTW